MKQKLFFFILLFAFCITCSSEIQAKNQPMEKASDFTIPSLSEEAISLSDFRGQIVILNFWTTWCNYCQEEMSELNKFTNENKAQNIVLIGVNVTSSESSKNVVSNFAKQFNLTFPIGLDLTGKVAKDYHLMGIPTTIIIDQKGIIRNKLLGPVTDDMLHNAISQL